MYPVTSTDFNQIPRNHNAGRWIRTQMDCQNRPVLDAAPTWVNFGGYYKPIRPSIPTTG